MKLEIVDSHYGGTLVSYNDYKGLIPSVGDDITIRGVRSEDGEVFNSREGLYVKERYLHFNDEGLESVSIWII